MPDNAIKVVFWRKGEFHVKSAVHNAAAFCVVCECHGIFCAMEFPALCKFHGILAIPEFHGILKMPEFRNAIPVPWHKISVEWHYGTARRKCRGTRTLLIVLPLLVVANCTVPCTWVAGAAAGANGAGGGT